MFVKTHPARLQPVRLQQFVKELSGPLIQVAERASFILIELHVWMPGQHFAN